MSAPEFRVVVGMTLEEIKSDLDEHGDKLFEICKSVGEHDKDIAVIQNALNQSAKKRGEEAKEKLADRGANIRGRWGFYSSIILGIATIICATLAVLK